MIWALVYLAIGACWAIPLRGSVHPLKAVLFWPLYAFVANFDDFA